MPETFQRIDRIRSLLLADPANTPECRLGWSVMTENLRGIRGLELASGIGDKQAWEITASYDGGLSPLGLVRTVERGTSWTSEGRLKGVYAFADTDRENVTKTSTYKNPPTPLGDKTLKGLVDLDGYRDVFASGIAMRVLDPSLDLWRRSKDELGSEGWRVAVITLLAPVTMTMDEWAELLQVSPASARKLAVKFEKKDIATRMKVGRTVHIALDWSRQIEVMEAMHRDDLMSRGRSLMNDYAKEQLRIQRPPSPEELEIRRRGKKPAQYASYLQDALDEAESPEHRVDLERLLHHFAGATEADWRRWFDAGRSLTEDEVYELAGIPKPEKPEPPKQPTPEELAAMVRRVTKEPEMPKVPEVLPVPQPAQAEDETEDDYVLRTKYHGIANLFETMEGRMPNQPPKQLDPRTEARLAKERRRRGRRTAGAVL
ncbi:hypothetical protein ACH5A3_02845 [Streptomyces echinatus]|uniref:hypothetical protein n=1 Tax=Streptomyces echinatus TaxID=67293 RepID=UPI003789F317